MPEAQAELDFATLAIAHKVVTREKMETARSIIEQEVLEGKPERAIEDVLLERGMIRAEEVWALYKARERLLKDSRTRGHRIGGYEIMGTLGEGGLGVVYKARQLSMGRIVALKVLHEKWVGDDEFRKRFLVEARLVGRLSHQNLIQVFDVGRHKNTLYYSMEFVDGETVEDKLDRDGPMELDEAISIIMQITRALKYLDEKKIVHRDVKPGNMMLTHDGVAKLGDFGFVKSSLDSVLSTEGEVLGTPDYISPEAALGEKDLDYRSDLYSLGASFYHMLCGQPPFGGSGSDVMEAHIKDSAPSLRNLAPGLPDGAIKLVEQLMAKDRNKRLSSFEELFRSLEALRTGDAGLNDTGQAMRAQARAESSLEKLQARQRQLNTKVRILTGALIATSGAFLATLCALLYFLLRK